ncbi:hypothetical protein GCM10023310_18580 [Paenibacillus vulneris]|uniref:Transposase DDE domain-containing protein n=1 Tax=Paenibacillus vulneris TaxID=1133364 RepID=A0ABW3UJL0_9BACL
MVMRTSRIPDIGETMQGEGFFLSADGKGANQADTRFMGKVGDDLFGQSLLDGLSGYASHRLHDACAERCYRCRRY